MQKFPVIFSKNSFHLHIQFLVFFKKKKKTVLGTFAQTNITFISNHFGKQPWINGKKSEILIEKYFALFFFFFYLHTIMSI